MSTGSRGRPRRTRDRLPRQVGQLFTTQVPHQLNVALGREEPTGMVVPLGLDRGPTQHNTPPQAPVQRTMQRQRECSHAHWCWCCVHSRAGEVCSIMGAGAQRWRGVLGHRRWSTRNCSCGAKTRSQALAQRGLQLRSKDLVTGAGATRTAAVDATCTIAGAQGTRPQMKVPQRPQSGHDACDPRSLCCQD